MFHSTMFAIINNEAQKCIHAQFHQKNEDQVYLISPSYEFVNLIHSMVFAIFNKEAKKFIYA